MKSNDIVTHYRFGKCNVLRIANDYSIPMTVVIILEGRLQGQEIIRMQAEFSTK